MRPRAPSSPRSHPTRSAPPTPVALLALVAAALLAGCKHDPAGASDGAPPPAGGAVAQGEARLLSVASPTKDEDPSLLRARDGTLFVAWFSDRGGNADIYVTSTRDGATWTTPVRVTTSPDGDFNPSLIQDDAGTFHLVWFRWNAPFRGHIWYNSSADGVTWRQSTETAITAGATVGDWTPTLTRAPDGTLLVYFASPARDAAHPTSDLYVVARRPGAAAWDPPVPLAALNGAADHDALPFAARTGDRVTLAWVRHDTRNVLPWMVPKSDVVVASSPDGLTGWSAPTRVTNDAGDVVNLFPALYARHDGAWSLLWLSTRGGSPLPVELPLTGAAQYPRGLAAVSPPLTAAGYSHRIAPMATAGLYVGVWVQGPEGTQDLYYRLFTR